VDPLAFSSSLPEQWESIEKILGAAGRFAALPYHCTPKGAPPENWSKGDGKVRKFKELV